jgi:endonuclease YncB( thermonuclease family)
MWGTEPQHRRRARLSQLKPIAFLLAVQPPPGPFPETPCHNTDHPSYGGLSRSELASLVLNRSVEIKSYGQERYGRTHAEVFVEGRNVNLEMVKAGLAEVYRGTPTLGLDLGLYWKAEEEAMKDRRGMWQLDGKYISPREWRHQKAQQ